MSWINDVKHNDKLKQLVYSSWRKNRGLSDGELLDSRVVGVRDTMSLVEYAWRLHVYPLIISNANYHSSLYNLFETYTSDQNSLLTGDMYEAVTKHTTLQDPATLLPESLVIAGFFNWGYSKEIYRFDDNIVEAIKDSECREYDASIFAKLPFDCFYLDCKVGQWGGALIVNYKDNYANKVLNIIMLSADYPNGKVDWYVKPISYDTAYTIDSSLGYEDDLKTYLNLINFLSCKNADIVGKEHIYVTDKKSGKRLTRADCRDYRITISFESEEQRNIVCEYSRVEKSEDKRLAHIRRAHWGKFWTYPRDIDGNIQRDLDKILVYHWIPPIYINGRTNNREKTHII